MTPEELRRRVRRTLGGARRARPGVLVHLRDVHELGFGPLMRLVDLLTSGPTQPLLLGFYHHGFDSAPRRIFGQSQSRLEVVRDTELDWDLWMAVPSDLRLLEEAISWPDLVVDGRGEWLIWTEDNSSFLCDMLQPDADAGNNAAGPQRHRA